MSESKVTVYVAVAANAAIAVTKFIAAAIGGSSSMLSEGIHSVVDMGDGLLVLLGLHLARKPSSRRHPYGHGAEVYFWSTVVAMSIFGAGGCVSIYEGVLGLLEPHQPSAAVLGLGVLGIAFVFEGVSWVVAIRSFRRVRGNVGVWKGIQRSKDPTTFLVVLEDSAALLGIVVAAAGIAIAHWFDAPMFDALGSIVIGLLLVTAGILLGRETWSLLLGESARGEIVESIRELAAAQPGVRMVAVPRTMHIGPHQIHVDLDLAVDSTISAVEVARRIEDTVRAEHPEIQRVSVRFPASRDEG